MYKLVQAATLVVAQGGGAASSGVSAFLGHQTLQTLQAFMQQQCQASMAAWPEEESSGEEEQELMRLPGRAVAIKFPEHEMAIAWCVFYQAPLYALCKRVAVIASSEPYKHLALHAHVGAARLGEATHSTTVYTQHYSLHTALHTAHTAEALTTSLLPVGPTTITS